MTRKSLLILTIGIFILGAASAQVTMHSQTTPPGVAGCTVEFKFVPGNDQFYIPWEGNGEALDGLLKTIEQNIAYLKAGRMYISVSSYAATGGGDITAERMGYLRNSRVKSELIIRAGVTEAMFVTDRVIREPYAQSALRNVVVVTLPAGEDKVAELAGAEAAARVAAFNREMSGEAQAERMAADQVEAERLTAEKAERERLAAKKAEQATREKAEAERLAAEQRERERAEVERAEVERLAAEAAAKAKPYCFAVRTNVLYDAMLLPTLGVEWRVNRDIGVKLEGSLAWWGGSTGKVQKIWMLNPEVRWYLLRDKRFYLGASGNYGQYNLYKYVLGGIVSKDTGYQGTMWGAGVTVGYQLSLSRSFAVDFNLGLGYTRFDYDSFTMTEGVRVYKDRDQSKNFWGPTQAGISLVWTIGGNK